MELAPSKCLSSRHGAWGEHKSMWRRGN
jgi:hypothetical protein